MKGKKELALATPILGRCFYDSDDSDTEYTITGVVGDDVTTSGGKHKIWAMKYVLHKICH